jgi:hypothetical protein
LPRRLRLVIVPLAAIASLAVCGCGDKGIKLVKVSGTVKYSDGTPVRGGSEQGRAIITFSPADFETEGRKGASAKIDAEGHYAIATLRPGDGVTPGAYKVIIRVWEKDGDASSTLIPEKFGSRETTDLTITVDKPRTDADFTVEKIR